MVPKKIGCSRIIYFRLALSTTTSSPAHQESPLGLISVHEQGTNFVFNKFLLSPGHHAQQQRAPIATSEAHQTSAEARGGGGRWATAASRLVAAPAELGTGRISCPWARSTPRPCNYRLASKLWNQSCLFVDPHLAWVVPESQQWLAAAQHYHEEGRRAGPHHLDSRPQNATKEGEKKKGRNQDLTIGGPKHQVKNGLSVLQKCSPDIMCVMMIF